jgi:hypothetical protein
MRRLVPGFWIMLLFTTLWMGQTDEWKKYKNTEGNFTVLFPGEPQDIANERISGTTSHGLLAQKMPVVYVVVWSVLDVAQPVNDANFEAFKNTVFNSLPKCTAGSDQPASPTFQGYIGHRYRLNCDPPQGKMTVVGSLYWGKRYSFAVMATFPANVPDPTEVKKFMESFAVIDPDK